MPRSIRIGDHLYEIRDCSFNTDVSTVSEVELSQPQWATAAIPSQSPPTRAVPQPSSAPRLNQAEIDRLLTSYVSVTTTDERRYTPPTQQLSDFDPNNLTIGERVGLNNMGIHRPRHYKRTGEKS